MSVFKIGPEFVTDSTTTPGARLTTADIYSRQGLTGSVWRDLNIDVAKTNRNYGFFYQETWEDWGETLDNSPVRNGKALLTQATAGTAAVISGPAGFPAILELDCASSTDNQGANLMFDNIRIVPDDNMVIYFEAMLRAKDIATGPQFYAGLAVPTSTAVITSGALATNIDRIGFSSVTDNGVVLLTACDGANADASGTVHTLVDGDTTTTGAEWVKLGFRWEYAVGVECYVNGSKKDVSALAITAEPDGVVSPAFVCQSAGTTDPIVHVASFAVGFKYK